MLRGGAAKVYAIDVGYGQLAWQLRQDPRVRVFERLNARYLEPGQIYQPGEEWADLAVIDVSFISLIKILPACCGVLRLDQGENQGQIICLIKPQFEIGKHKVGKGGVVLSAADHIEVVDNLIKAGKELNLQAQALIYSPIKGPAGNIEFLLYLSRRKIDSAIDVKSIVNAAHEKLL